MKRRTVLISVGAASLLAAGTALATLATTLTVGSIQVLGAPADIAYAYGYAANASGTVVGYGWHPYQEDGKPMGSRALRSVNGQTPEILPLPTNAWHPLYSGYAESHAYDVAENGTVLGGFYTWYVPCAGCGYYYGVWNAAVWDAQGAVTILPPGHVRSDGWSHSSAHAISPSGRHVVGYTYFSDHGAGYARWVLGGGAPVPLATPTTNWAFPLDVNDAGVAVGYRAVELDDWYYYYYNNQAVRWSADGQTLTDLQKLVPDGASDPVHYTSVAHSVLADGSAVGYQDMDPDASGPAARRYYAVRWDADGVASDISPAGATTALAYEANEDGVTTLIACLPSAGCQWYISHDGNLQPISGGGIGHANHALSEASGGSAWLAGVSWFNGKDQFARWPISVATPNAAPIISFASASVGTTEGAAFVLAPTVTDDGPTPLTFEWDVTNDGTDDFAPGAATLTFTPTDNGFFPIRVRVTDGAGAVSDVATVTVAATNVAPKVTQLVLPAAPVAINTSVSATAHYADPGSGDTHIAKFTWDWDLVGNAAASTASSSSAAGASGTATAATTFDAAGVYTVQVVVTDDDGGSGARVSNLDVPAYVVVYDPSAGFVTGGGWIVSPAGACLLSSCTTETTGKATFGFVSRYRKGATTPDGNTEFDFAAGGLRFKSSSYQWLVVSGARGQFKGEGTINGVGGFRFLLTAVDGQANGGGGSDRFRIKLWRINADGTDGEVVYDNQMGTSDDSDASATLGGGSIVIHSK